MERPRLPPLSSLRTAVTVHITPELLADWTAFADAWEMSLEAVILEGVSTYIDTARHVAREEARQRRDERDEAEDVA